MVTRQDFIQEFKDRGYYYQCTDEEALAGKLKSPGEVGAYIGFDCTATSLHVGSLMQIMTLRLFQKYGIKPIVLIGGGTTKIGDPTGKDKARKVLDDAAIAENIEGIKKSLSKFISFGSGASDAVLLNNDDWLSDIKYLDFLRDIGKHFSVNRMLSFESVKLRLEREQNMSFLEFNYMILQGYDFLHLNKHHNCFVQCGGSDQWGNIINGVELTRRVEGKEAFGLTTPLITTSSGEKMGKTEGGAVWLNEDMLSPYEYYQYWRNVEDDDVIRFMKFFTDLSVPEIDMLAKENTNINDLKKKLAFEVTKMCHGESAAAEAEQTAISVFEKGEITGVEEFEISEKELDGNLFLYQLYAKSGLAESNGAAKRLIKGGGAKLNKEKISDENYVVTKDDFGNNTLIISSGKKKHMKIILKD
ncbi:MAG: tyrosine--tRNA ligase [Rickettsiales bacterium]